ncbi:MAG: hypothetical protein NUV50_13330, partial [Rhodospirillales bacterium]|nr:hypothetical protein [Rhodospirillales bacterium]
KPERLSPAATPAQQARNIAQARQFTAQQRAAEANASAAAARTRQTVKDYLGKTQSTRTPATATRRAHAIIPQGGTWLDSVQAQTGYRLTPAATIVKEKRSWLEPAWNTGVTIGQTWDEIKDRALNPNRNHMFDKEQTNMSPAEALTGPAQYGGAKLLSGGAAIGSNTIKNPVGSILGIVSDILDYFAEQQKRDYLEPRLKINKK